MRTKILSFLILLALPFPAMAGPITADQLWALDGLDIHNGKGVYSLPEDDDVTEEILTESGSQSVANKTFDKTSNVFKQARCVYKVSDDGGATDAEIELTDCVIPAKSVVSRVFMDITTGLAGDTNTAVALKLVSAADLFASMNYTGYGGGLLNGTPAATTDTSVKTSTAALSPKVNLSGGKLTAGEFVLFVDFYVSK